MSTKLQDLFKQYSNESAEEAGLVPVGENHDESGVGATQLLITTEETTTELDEAIEDLAEKCNQHTEVESKIEQVISATESLESIMALVESNESAGRTLNGFGAAAVMSQIRESFEARGIDEVLYKDMLDNMEVSFEDDSKSDKTNTIKKSASNVVTRITNFVNKLIEAAKNFGKDMLESIRGTSAAVRSSGDALIEISKKIPLGAKPKGKLSLSTWGDCFIGDSAHRTVLNLGEVLNELKRLKISDEVDESKENSAKSVAKIEVGGGDQVEILDRIDNGRQHVQVVVHKGEKKEGEVDALDAVNIAAMGKSLTKVADNLEDFNKHFSKQMDEYSKIATKVSRNKAIDEAEGVGRISKLIAKLISSLTSRNQSSKVVVNLVVGRAKKLYSLGKASAALHMKSDSDKKDEDKK